MIRLTAIVVTVYALIVIGVSIPMVKGMVPPNGFYGARFRKSFESSENWYKINCYAGRKLIWGGVVNLMIAISVLFLPVGDTTTNLLVLAAVPVVTVVTAAIISWKYAQSL
jgi:uncharacterized membrane protein